MERIMVSLRLPVGFVGAVLLIASASVAGAQEAPGSMESGPVPILRRPPPEPAPVQETQPQQPREALPPVPPYDPAIFQKRIPPDQLAFLKSFAGETSGQAIGDRQFHKLMDNSLPDCMFHYGRDMSMFEAIETVLKGSPVPVTIRDGRYMTLAGRSGPYLGGRGFVWIDLQEGIALGGFYFHPTNGEPTPTVTVFSRQVKDEALEMSQLPPEFAVDLAQWSQQFGVPQVTTRYFITGSNKRILLEHDEDYCSNADGTVAPPGDSCEQMIADAADLDMDTAYYLEQIHYATNGTAWMIKGDEQVAWIGVRDRTCGGVLDPLGCRIRLTREHVGVIVHRPVVGRPKR
jgi:uncharacterized protein YecT (DUF1311 family)